MEDSVLTNPASFKSGFILFYFYLFSFKFLLISTIFSHSNTFLVQLMMLALTEENSYLYISNCEKLKGTVPSVKSSIKTHPAENISIEASNSPELANSASSADSSGMIELVKV